jgi:hypothetical protein
VGVITAKGSCFTQNISLFMLRTGFSIFLLHNNIAR